MRKSMHLYDSDLSCYVSDCTTDMTIDKCRESKGLKRCTFKYGQGGPKKKTNNSTFIKAINYSSCAIIFMLMMGPKTPS